MATPQPPAMATPQPPAQAMPSSAQAMPSPAQVTPSSAKVTMTKSQKRHHRKQRSRLQQRNTQVQAHAPTNTPNAQQLQPYAPTNAQDQEVQQTSPWETPADAYTLLAHGYGNSDVRQQLAHNNEARQQLAHNHGNSEAPQQLAHDNTEARQQLDPSWDTRDTQSLAFEEQKLIDHSIRAFINATSSNADSPPPMTASTDEDEAYTPARIRRIVDAILKLEPGKRYEAVCKDWGYTPSPFKPSSWLPDDIARTCSRASNICVWCGKVCPTTISARMHMGHAHDR